MKDSIARSADVVRLLGWFDTLLERGVPEDIEMVALALDVLELRRYVSPFLVPRVQAIRHRIATVTHSYN